MDRWWQSWGEVIARRLARRWQSRRERGTAGATPPTGDGGSEIPRAEDDEPGGDENLKGADGKTN
jgi:hypothetical protein